METFEFLSVLPVIVAVVLAVAFKNVVIALFLSVLTGVLILVEGSPITAITTMIEKYFFVQLTDSYNAGVLVLLAFIGGFIALMEKSGGATAFAKNMAKYLDTRFKVQLAAWFGGIVVFFSDLGTPLIVGPVFEPMFDKLKVSREKLAWVLDSTASPVAVLVPFIGWGVYIMGLIQKEFDVLEIAESDWSAFINSIPFNIYSILVVLIVPVVAFTGYEFSAMAKAEKRTQDTGEKYWKTSKPMRISEVEENPNSKPILVWLPILVLLVTLCTILVPLGFPFQKVAGSAFRGALSSGYLLAAVVLMFMIVFMKVKNFDQTFKIYMQGVNKMTYVAVILVLSWSLSSVSKELGTSDYIIRLVSDGLPPWLLPSIVFLIGAVLSFATGTSWGAYAIMLPIVIPMALAIDAQLYVSIGAVLSGGMLGDHCSPISDTTILSSTGAGCDHIDHVKTQLPYSIVIAVSSVVGYIIGGFTGSPIALLVSGVVAVIIMILSSKVMGVKIENVKMN